MEYFARTFIFLEILLINLITSHYCSEKKHSLMRVIASLTLFTGLIFLFVLFIRYKLELQYINGNIVLLLGLMYFFPLKLLYNEPSYRTLTIMFFSWIHTMTVTYLSKQISEFCGFENRFTLALIVQTIIYFFSTPVFIKYTKNQFIYILKNIPSKLDKHLVALSLVKFMLLSIACLYFTENSTSYWQVLTIILVLLSATISYHLLYIVVKNYKNIESLKQLAYSDALTGIKNRLALFLDCDKLIPENKPFACIFMDLDNFKKINDTYGHCIGDNYLKHFTKVATEIIGSKGDLYRMSGDEFICIFTKNEVDTFLKTFEKKIIELFKMSIPFLGVSIGYAKFPEDTRSIDKLISKADKTMYEVKENRKLKTNNNIW